MEQEREDYADDGRAAWPLWVIAGALGAGVLGFGLVAALAWIVYELSRPL